MAAGISLDRMANELKIFALFPPTDRIVSTLTSQMGCWEQTHGGDIEVAVAIKICSHATQRSHQETKFSVLPLAIRPVLNPAQSVIGLGNQRIHRITTSVNYIQSTIAIDIDHLKRTGIVGWVFEPMHNCGCVITLSLIEIDFDGFILLSIGGNNIEFAILIHVGHFNSQYAMPGIERFYEQAGRRAGRAGVAQEF